MLSYGRMDLSLPTSMEFQSNQKIFIQANTFVDVVNKIPAILFGT